MKLIEWMFPLKKIKQHQEVLKKTNQSVDSLLAALDGETGWFDCGCIEKSELEAKKETVNHGTLSNSKQRQCIN